MRRAACAFVLSQGIRTGGHTQVGVCTKDKETEGESYVRSRKTVGHSNMNQKISGKKNWSTAPDGENQEKDTILEAKKRDSDGHRKYREEGNKDLVLLFPAPLRLAKSHLPAL